MTTEQKHAAALVEIEPELSRFYTNDELEDQIAELANRLLIAAVTSREEERVT